MLKLFKQFILRSLHRQRLRSALTVLGIALGVAVAVAIQLANAGSLESFRAATSSIAGETSIQITGAAGRFDENQLAGMDWLREYGDVSPVIDGYALAEEPGGKGSGEFLHVLGVDILSDRSLRRYNLLRLNATGQPSSREFLLLLADPGAIVLTQRFARERGLDIGSRITLDIGDARKDMTVRGLLLDEGPARALDGRFALMDIAAAQWAFDRLGRLDRLDVKLKSGTSLAEARNSIARRLPVGLKVSDPAEQYGQIEKMIAAFHFNLNALGSIALLVGLFLVYNTISISVIDRRDEIGMLRAVGLTRRAGLALFLGEAALMSIAGTLIGLPLGRLMAGTALKATSATVNTFYVASAATSEFARHALGVKETALAFGICLPLSLLAAALPALEASRVKPVEAIRGAERLAESLAPPRHYLAISAALFLLGYFLTKLNAIDGLPIFGYLSACALMFAGAFLVPGVMWLACRVLARLSTFLSRLRVDTRLAAANLAGSIPRTSISVAALSVSLAMMISVSIMISSFRDTVSYWVDQTLGADIYAKPLTRQSTISDGEISADALALVKSDPAVAAVDPFTSNPAAYAGRQISIAGGDFAVLLNHGRLMFKSPGDAKERMRQAIGRNIVSVSESFSLLFGKQPGDEIELPTPLGPHRFEIGAVYYDYSSNRGTVVMDRSIYDKLFAVAGPEGSIVPAPSSLSIYLRPGSDEEAVARRLSNSLAQKYQLIFSTNGQIRREAMRIFDSTFSITYALEAIAILVAALGVITALITLILERRRDIAMLRFIGATRSQIRRMIVGEAVLIGGVSQAVGALIGVLLSLVLIYVINVQSFGWTIQYHFPTLFLVQSTVLLILLAGVAGFYPAHRASKVDAVSVAREE